MKTSFVCLVFILWQVSTWGNPQVVPSDRNVIDTTVHDSVTYMLDEIIVSSSLVKRKVDRFILSVPPALNKNGVELLKQAPGVWLSDEQISINGASGTKVYVDDREIKLTGASLVEYLRSLRSEDISRVEILPLTGADKDANAQGGAIYIIMRQRTVQGVMGNVSMNTSLASGIQCYKSSAGLNVAMDRWSLYATGSGTWMPQNKGEMFTTREYAEGDKGFSSRTLMGQSYRYNTARTGVVYVIDTLNSVGAEFEYVNREYTAPSQSYSRLSAGSVKVESAGVYRKKDSYDMFSMAINYVHKLDMKGSVMKVLADYVSKDSRGVNDCRVVRQPGVLVDDTVYRSSTSAVHRIATVDALWKQQLTKSSSLQVGMKYTYTGMKDDAFYEGQESNGTWEPNPTYGYILDYSEHISACYGTYSFKWNRASAKLGLRAEYMQTRNHTECLRRNAWNWFPHVDGSFCFDEMQQWMLVAQYGRYVERPAFAALNPSRIQTSDYGYQIGNPDLRPTYINKFSLTLVYNSRYTLTVGGNFHQDLIRQFTRQEPGRSEVSYVTYENHHRENHWFAAINAPWQPTTWLNVTTNVVGVKQNISMHAGDKSVNHYLYFGNANVVFYLPSDYSLEGQYSGASRLFSGNSGVEPFHTVNVQLRKKWKEGCYTTTLGLDNVFNCRNTYFSHLPDYQAVSRMEQASAGRQLKLTFTWNFKQGKKTNSTMLEKQSAGERSRLEAK